MKHIAWFFKWLLKAAIFFTLFAFALHNQHEVTVHFFFKRQWSGPLVLVVLSAFGLGLAIGVLGMVPRWWKQRRAAARARQSVFPPSKLPPEPEKPPASVPYGI
jgi:lipopolysaccharide assembly protein A